MRLRRGLSSALSGLISMLIIATAAVGITILYSSAAGAHQAELTLANVGADLHAIDSLEWQAIGGSTELDEVRAGLDERLRGLRDRVSGLGTLGLDKDGELSGAIRRYTAAVSEELTEIVAGRREEALEIDEAKVDPAFESVTDLIGDLAIERGAFAAREEWKARLWTLVILVVSSALIALLTWRDHRAARRATALARDAQTDHLTGLPNQRAFDAELARALARAKRSGQDLSLALIDIDLFKRVNDLHGHQAGDVVLVELARELSRLSRAGEAVARVGGEEFAWILPGANEASAWQAVERARISIAEARLGGLAVTVSAGVASLATTGSPEQLVQGADAALYRAKARGRNVAVRAAASSSVSAPGASPATDAARPPEAVGDVEALIAAARSPLIDAVQEGILVRDVAGIILQVNEHLCAITGFARDELVGLGAPYPFWPPEHAEDIARSFERSREGLAVHDFEFRRKDGSRFPAVVSTVPIRGPYGELVGHVRTIKDITNRKRAEEAERLRVLGTVRSLARAIDAKDPTTLRHSERVADLAAKLATHLGWPEDRVEALHAAGLVHDVGKIGIPEAILTKPGRLSADEYEIVKGHSAIGADIVEGVLGREQVSWVRHHHERIDGRGYPDGLSGDAIPDGAKLMALADAWDAMTSLRPYSDALSTEAALAECRAQAGAQFDPEAVAALEQVMDDERARPTRSVHRALVR